MDVNGKRNPPLHWNSGVSMAIGRSELAGTAGSSPTAGARPLGGPLSHLTRLGHGHDGFAARHCRVQNKPST